MISHGFITYGMAVVDTKNNLIGLVDRVQDYAVELADQGFGDGMRHFVPIGSVIKIVDNTILVEAGRATTVEVVANASRCTRKQRSLVNRLGQAFGTPGDASGMGGWGAR